MSFNMRTSKPSAGNKFYNNGKNGGYSWCIEGKPTDRGCNVLSNCVGYACGRFNEIMGSMKYKTLCCNAENFIERAKQAGLQVVDYPTLGGIMVWQKGTLSGNDGAGHVAVVERIDSNNQIYTSESGYGGSPFWNSIRKNNNGRWGLGSGYTFRGCIVNPAIGDVHYIAPIPTPAPQPTPTPMPTPSDLKVGDKVKIIGKGNGSSYGDSNTAGGIGWQREILKVWNGRPYPYQVGNSTGTTGFYKASALQKL